MRQSLIIMTLCVISPLLLSSCWWNKEIITPADTPEVVKAEHTIEELQAIFDQVDKQVIAVESWSVDVLNVLNYASLAWRDFPQMIRSITWSDELSVSKRAFLKSYLGDYSGALAERRQLCESQWDNCWEQILTIELWSVLDQEDQFVGMPNISINGTSVPTDSNIVQSDIYSDMVNRVRLEKEWYMDAYDKINSLPGVPLNISISPVMARADSSVEMDNQVGGVFSAGTWSSAFTYTIEPDTFVLWDSTSAKWKIQVYFFAFWKEDQWLSTFRLDTFSENGISIGGNMVTDGMPFITAYQDGKSLKIAKPISGIGTLSPNSLNPMDLENVPKNTWLDNNALLDYWIPGYWHLNRETGVWTSSVMQILDNNGTYKFNFQ